ncbi:hypothetical protein POE72_001980 [Enterobacter ludwigii]|uniref:O-methyltransferase n=1 Tax=Enterobacter ludwigii TaxID=299767 RepID=UPI001C8B1BE6|nr:O-methyltransferase [Enterobacter ludwigii]EKS7111196.1 hypothetical protein [Enterobacter ludwigii]MBX9029824.1 hypothetical protein [Enterobacter ludwigii]
MANSGKKINYAIRPAKNIERKMFRDMLIRLFPFGIFSKYQYIGFGSKYFVDFTIIHKHLHINDMISIESDTTNQERYIFNKPYECIDVKFGRSTEILPKLDLNKKTIIWLDYDSAFSNYMLEDISTLVSKLPSGSIICISYNSHPYQRIQLEGEYPDISDGYYRAKFEEIFGEEHIPGDFSEQGWTNKTKFSKLIRNIVNSQITTVLSSRNNIEKPRKQWINCKQILYFDYADNANMSTLCFALVSEEETPMLNACNLEELDFYRDSATSYEIKIPNLTSKEVRYLMEKMPNEGKIDLQKNIFNDNDVEEFKKNYRYYPSFTEIESF